MPEPKDSRALLSQQYVVPNMPSLSSHSLAFIQDAKHLPFVRFAEGALAGKFKGHEVFTGLVNAMVTKIDKEERGVRMQNFSYTPAWDEFVHIVSIHSPRAHKFLLEHFPAQSMRNIW
jgi:hypothetical protein